MVIVPTGRAAPPNLANTEVMRRDSSVGGEQRIAEARETAKTGSVTCHFGLR